MKIRKISGRFVSDLKDEDKRLNWVFKKVMAPDSLFSLEIREGYINIYYRGGSILKITEPNEDGQDYKFEFDKKYGKKKNGDYCKFMGDHQNDVAKLTNETAQSYFDEFIVMMDRWFKEHPKPEREFQHYMSLQKNNENVLDIEYAIDGMRIDMILIGKEGELYLVENKYGNGSLSSELYKGKEKAGLAKHYGDFIKVLTEKKYINNIKESMESILEIKQELGMIPTTYRLKLDKNGKPSFNILFVLADLTLSPKSKIIDREKQHIEKDYKSYKFKFTPKVLCVGKEQYSIDLNNAQELLTFSLKNR